MLSHLTLGPADGHLLLFTTVEGRAARLGHALTLRVDAWECQVQLDGEVPTSVQLVAQLASLQVVEATGGVKPLSDKDQRTIRENAVQSMDADRYPRVTFTSTQLDGLRAVHGQVDLHGTSHPLEVAVTVAELDGGSHLTATTTIRQSRFGITPYSQLRGALQVGDDVAVRLDALVRR